MNFRDPTRYTKRDRALEDAEDEIECAMGAISEAIAQCERQRGVLTDTPLCDAANALRDVLSNLQGAHNQLADKVYEDA